MRLAVMQPYFFPYLGYLALIKHSDYFVIFDTPQFIRHGWIERNRILKPGEGWQYIKVPLEKHNRNTSIKEIKINNRIDWKRKILAQLGHYKNKAPYYKETLELVRKAIDINTESITNLNIHVLKEILDYLGIEFKYDVFSEMQLNIEKPEAADEWALNISKSLEAKEYINPPGGISFFNKEKYKYADIKLKFLYLNIKNYNQKRDVFEPGLSIIDVMMFNSSYLINEMLDDYEFE